MGVWIETCWTCERHRRAPSHPSWVCGLKQLSYSVWFGAKEVTPFVGVWIETGKPSMLSLGQCGHTLRGCVDWNSLRGLIAKIQESHTLRGCVDWNTEIGREPEDDYESHPSWVCGLKPNRVIKKYNRKTSHPSWVCGLKLKRPIYFLISSCHTLRGCVDWNSAKPLIGVC